MGNPHPLNYMNSTLNTRFKLSANMYLENQNDWDIEELLILRELEHTTAISQVVKSKVL